MLFKIMDENGQEVSEDSLSQEERDQVNKIYSKWKKILKKDATLSPSDKGTLYSIIDKEGTPIPPVGTEIYHYDTIEDGEHFTHLAAIILPEPLNKSFIIGVKYPLTHSFSVLEYKDNDNVIEGVTEEEKLNDVSLEELAHGAKTYYDFVIEHKPTAELLNFDEFFRDKKDGLIARISEKMKSSHPSLRLPLQVVSNLLASYSANETHQLVNFTLLCFNTLLTKNVASEELSKKIDTLGILSNNLAQTLTRPLFYVEQQILIKMINFMPEYTEWNNVDNLKIIFNEIDNPYEWIVLGYLECLEKTQYSSIQEENTLTTLIKTFFNTKSNDLDAAINNPTLQSNSHLDKFRQIHDTYIIDNDNIKKIEPEFLHKMIVFFSECWEDLTQLQEAYQNEPNKEQLLYAIKYVEKAQNNGRFEKIGMTKDFVKTLLSDEFRNADAKKIGEKTQRFSDQKNTHKRGTGLFNNLPVCVSSSQIHVSNNLKNFK